MNIFRDTLQRIAGNVEGTLAVSIVGLDGIPIDFTTPEQTVSIEEVAAELGAFVKRLESPRAETQSGQIRELVVAAERSVAILSRITPEYYLLLLLSGDGNVGRGRWELKKAALTLQEELA